VTAPGLLGTPVTIGTVKTRAHIVIPSPWSGYAWVFGIVLVLHWLALAFLQDQLTDGAGITPMPTPIFMRVLKPLAVVVPPPRPRKSQKPVGTPRPTVLPPVVAADSSPQDTLEGPAAGVVASSESSADPSTPQGLAEPVAEVPDEPAAPDEVPQSSWPADTRLSYALKGYYRGDFAGDGRVQWQRMEGRYQVQVDLHIASLFTGTMISQGELTETGLQPRVYEERFMGRIRRLTFDGLGVTFADGRVFPQPQGVQDTSSQFVELSHRFSTGLQPLVVGSQVALWLARPREMRFWTYDVVALETLQIPEFGAVPAYHLKPRQIANPTGVITAELWFAPSLQFLPVRIRINLGNDNYMDWLVNRIEQGEAPATPATQAPPKATERAAQTPVMF
jgi:hypothetical protein